MSTPPAQQQQIQTWKSAERKLIAAHTKEYDKLRELWREKVAHEKAKNNARRDLRIKYYNEFKQYLTEERLFTVIDRNDNKFILRVVRLKEQGAPRHLVNREIKRNTLLKAHVAMRTLYQQEYLSLKEEYTKLGYSTSYARAAADLALEDKYRDQFTQIFGDINNRTLTQISERSRVR